MDSKTLKILFVGDGRYSNRGCEAIVRGTVNILSHKFENARFILSSFGKNTTLDAKTEKDSRILHRIPAPPIERYKLSWWRYRVPMKIFPQRYDRYVFGVQLDALKESMCSLMIGGDNYSLEYGIPRNFIRFNELLISNKKPKVLWGCSVGPFSANPEVESIMARQLSQFSLITARETETVSYLKSIGVEKNVKLVADPAFVMQPQKPLLSGEILSFIEKKPIGLNLNPMVGRYRGGHDVENWLGESSAIIKRLVESDLPPLLLVPHVTDLGQNDYEFMCKVVEYSNGWSERVKILPPHLGAEEYKYVISKLQGFAGARTHTTIASLSSCVPTISIGYSMKARGINKDIFGHTDWVLPVGEISPDALLEKFSKLLSQQKEIKKHLLNTIPLFQERAYAAASYLADVLDH